nr:MAG TPA: hypothetical protein [Microviridae sp.]
MPNCVKVATLCLTQFTTERQTLFFPTHCFIARLERKKEKYALMFAI